MTETKPAESKALLLFRTFCALPMFLILTIIFWELVLGASLLSHWFYDRGWNILGFSARVVWILLAGLTICSIVIFFVGWIMLLIRVVRGRVGLPRFSGQWDKTVESEHMSNNHAKRYSKQLARELGATGQSLANCRAETQRMWERSEDASRVTHHVSPFNNPVNLSPKRMSMI